MPRISDRAALLAVLSESQVFLAKPLAQLIMIDEPVTMAEGDGHWDAEEE